MRLWLLRPRDDVLARARHPWAIPHGKTWGVLVRSKTEADARALAQTQAGLEGQGIYRRFGGEEDEVAAEVWLDPAWTSCGELVVDARTEVILVDRR